MKVIEGDLTGGAPQMTSPLVKAVIDKRSGWMKMGMSFRPPKCQSSAPQELQRKVTRVNLGERRVHSISRCAYHMNGKSMGGDYGWSIPALTIPHAILSPHWWTIFHPAWWAPDKYHKSAIFLGPHLQFLDLGDCLLAVTAMPCASFTRLCVVSCPYASAKVEIKFTFVSRYREADLIIILFVTH